MRPWLCLWDSPIVTSSTQRKKRQMWQQHWNPPNYATQPHTTTLQLSTDATLRPSKITQKFKRVTKTLGELRESISIKTNYVKSWNGTLGFGERKFRNGGFSNWGDCNRNLVSTHKCEDICDAKRWNGLKNVLLKICILLFNIGGGGRGITIGNHHRGTKQLS